MSAVSAPLIDSFSRSYREAREKFLASADARNLAVEHRIHPAKTGVDGETLAMDFILAGPPSANALLVLTSGTHGIEGYCGSACQTSFLRDDALLYRLQAHEVADQ